MLAYHKQCIICGTFFRPNKHNQLTCASKECLSELYRRHNKKRYHDKRNKKKGDKMPLLTKEAVAAYNLGISYGQYKARQWFRNKGGGEKKCLETT